MQKIIFLDIDGPVIHQPCYYIDIDSSFKRSVVSTTAIGYLNKLCTDYNAKIVCNSTHNDYIPFTKVQGDLKHDLIRHGVDGYNFHVNWRTGYPNNLKGKATRSSSTNRLVAIELWQEENGVVDWICYDDDRFTQDKRLYCVSFERGIDMDAYMYAVKRWDKDKIKSSLAI